MNRSGFVGGIAGTAAGIASGTRTSLAAALTWDQLLAAARPRRQREYLRARRSRYPQGSRRRLPGRYRNYGVV